VGAGCSNCDLSQQKRSDDKEIIGEGRDLLRLDSPVGGTFGPELLLVSSRGGMYLLP